MEKFKNSAFTRFFTKFPKLLLGGLLFSAPLAFFTGLFVLISYLTGFNNVIVWGLSIIPSTPFLAGLVMVIRKYAVEKQDVSVVKTFFLTVKENILRFLIHGVIIYAIVACSFFALIYYYTLSQGDPVFGAVLTLYLIFTVLLVVLMYYVPIMTITYELKMKDIYKNAFLLVFGKILRNLIATVFIGVIIVLAVLLISYAPGIWFGISIGVMTVILPLVVTYIIVSIISKGLQDTVGDFVAKPVDPEILERERAHEQELASNTDSDYVFVNGRMIKRTTEKSSDKE